MGEEKEKEADMRMRNGRSFSVANRSLAMVVVCTVLLLQIFGGAPVHAHRYEERSVGGLQAKIVTMDLKADGLMPTVVIANGMLTSSRAVDGLASSVNAVAAINGTYFDPYGYNQFPLPYDAIIRDGRLLHIGSRSLIGFKADGTPIMDRISFEFICYNQNKNQIAAYPWTINHDFGDAGAIMIYTSEYGRAVNVRSGAKAIVVTEGKVSRIETSSFSVPAGSFAIVFNSASAFLVDRFPIGETVDWEYRIKTKYTSAEEWNDVVTAVGAGPLLVANGKIVANPAEEGFHEAKILSQATPRSFIGWTKDGRIVMGNFASATVAQAAQGCSQLGLDYAMCLDGGGSVGLYYQGVTYSKGRDVNNALVFVSSAGADQRGTMSDHQLVQEFKFYAQKNYDGLYYVDGEAVKIDGYIVNSNTYFKLRDLAMLFKDVKPFGVSYDAEERAIRIEIGEAYQPEGGELTIEPEVYNKLASKSAAKLYVNGRVLDLEAYVLEGNTYFRLRDILKELDVYVGYEPSDKSIRIDTSKSYE